MTSEPEVTPVAGVMVVARRQQQFLAVRASEGSECAWRLPEGDIHLGERMSEAAVRVLGEWIGLDAKSVDVVTYVERRERNAEGRLVGHRVLVGLLLDCTSDVPGPHAPNVRWVDIERPDGPITDETREVLLALN